MKVRKFWKLLVVMGALSAIVIACQPQTVEVEVTRVVTETITESGEEVEVTRIVTESETITEEVVVTATPEPVEQVIIGAFDVGPGGDPQGALYLGPAGYQWKSKLFTPLVMMTADYSEHTTEGALATNWEPNEDATLWTFTLREGVVWHDGEPFTADDVKFTAEFVHAPGSVATQPFLFDVENGVVGFQAYQAGEADEIEGIRVIDDTTIEFELQAPNPRFFDFFRQFFVLPEHAIDFAPEEWATTDWFLERPVGTGPWKFGAYEKDQFMELVPNEDYWDGAPLLDKLINRYFVDETAAVLALTSGDIDFTYAGADVAARFRGDDRYQIFEGPSFVTNMFNYNYERPTWNDVRVRQAMMYGIDRQSIIDGVFDGTAQAAPCEDPYPAFWPEDANYYEYDPARAEELLAEAAADGIELSGEYSIPTYYSSQLASDILTVMQANLAEISVDAVPLVLDVPSWRVQINENADFDFTYRGRGMGPATYLTDWYETGNQWGIEDSRYQEIIDEMNAAFTWEEYTEARTELCRYQNEQATFAYWWVSTRYGVARAGLNDFHFFPAPGGGPVVDDSHLWSK